MSEQENNVCAICGGVKRVDWTISFEECRPVEVRFIPESLANNWQLCPGHPEPAEKHDGKLPGRRVEDSYSARIGAKASSGVKHVWVEGAVSGMGGENIVCLEPQQALSLRDWLIQNSPELERMVKEAEQA